MRFNVALAGLACAVASTAIAQPTVEVTRSVYVERDREGTRTIEPASQLRSGDKVVLVMQWRAPDAGRGVTVASEVPRALAFQRSGVEAEVSADGGRSWGELGALRRGQRLASAEDVTHLRWRIPANALADGRGTLSYSAIVR